MALINEWILKDDLKDSVGSKDLMVYGSGALKQNEGAVLLDGTYGLRTDGAYPLPSNYTLSIIVEMTELTGGGGYNIIFGNGWGQSYVGNVTQGITQAYNGSLVTMTGTGDGYSSWILPSMEVNKRYHFIMNMTSSGLMKFYIDGVKVIERQLATSTKGYPLTIGGYANSSIYDPNWIFMKGKVSNARLYDHAISDDEALELYNYYLVKNRDFILHNGEKKTWSEGQWLLVESIENDGMKNLSLLNRRVQELDVISSINNDGISSTTIDLDKYFEIKKIKTEVK